MTVAQSLVVAFRNGESMHSIQRECRASAVVVKGCCEGTGCLYWVDYTLSDGSTVRLVNPYGYDWPGCSPNVEAIN